MEILIVLLLLVIAAETTYLTNAHVRKYRHTYKGQQPMFLDTSVLIDGRIVPLMKSGFITSTVLIPRSVVGELQLLADTGDTDKRARARHGLDVVNELKSLKDVQVELFNDSNSAPEGVDNRLLALAKQHKGSLCTIDFNLNKVAQVEGIRVLNVNDLTKTLRMAYLPGEIIMLELTQKGNDSHQAIGHLQDGTMVVVERASSHVGKVKKIEFIRSLQTAAGKMMFAKLVEEPNAKVPAPEKQRTVAPKVPKGRQPKPQLTPRDEQTPRDTRDSKPTDKKEARNNNTSNTKPRRRQTNEDRMVELANQ